MLQPRARWVFPTPIDLDPGLVEAGLGLGLSARVVAILARRGVTTPAGLRAFLGPPEAALHDPRLLPTLYEDARRLAQSLEDASRRMAARTSSGDAPLRR